MKIKPKFAEKLYSEYLDEFGETVPHPNGKKPLKLTKQRFAGLYGFDTWRDLKELIETNNPGEMAEHVSTLDADIKRHTTPLIIDILLKDKTDVAEVLMLHVKLGALANDDVENFTKQKSKGISKDVHDVLIDLFAAYEPATKFNLRLADIQFISEHLWDSSSLKTRLVVFQMLNVEKTQLPMDKLAGLWEEANALLSDRTNTPHWGNFAHANKEAIRRLTGTAVQHSLVTIDELMALYNDKPKLNAELELQMLSSSSWQKGLFGDQGQHITLTDALLWLFKGNGLAEEDVEVLRFYDKHCCLMNLNDKPEPLAKMEPILTSCSLIAAPVLATHLLYTLGRNDFTVERLFAAFFCLNKVGYFASLIEELQSLAKTGQCHSYSNEDMSNELIAAIILTRNATNIRKAAPEQFDIYLDALTSSMEAGHYALVLKEYSRFIELTNLESVPVEFVFLFKDTLEKITDEQLNTLTTQDINGAYLLAKRMLITSDRLKALASEETVALGAIFDNDAAMDVLAVRNAARKKKLEDIYGAVDAFGYNYNTKTNPGQFNLGAHREPLECKLFDALALSCASEPDQIKARTALSAELAPLLYEDEPSYQPGNHRGAQLHRVSNVSELANCPGNLTNLYEKLSKSVGSNLLYSKEVLIKLHIEGFVPDDLVQCGRSYFVAMRGGDMSVFGEVNSQDLIFTLLAEFRPKTVTNVSVYSIEINSMARDDYPCGSLIAEQKSISLLSGAKWEKDVLEMIQDTFKKIDIEQYYGKNPLADVARRLSPVFDCCGARFNPGGTVYTAKQQDDDNSLEAQSGIADLNTFPTAIAS